MSVFADLRDMEREMEELTHRMPELDPSSGEYLAVADRFHRLDSEFRARDGYALEAQTGSVLSGLGFPHSDWNRRPEEFSRGWQVRLARRPETPPCGGFQSHPESPHPHTHHPL